MADSPGASWVTPLIGTALLRSCELSSIFQPVRVADTAPTVVSSNQSTAYWLPLAPLLHGETSVTRKEGPLLAATAVTVSVYVELVASGEAPTPGSSTVTLT